MSENAPDFAIRRAIEILAQICERQRRAAAPAPCERPVLLFSETLALDVNTTTRADVERKLGVGFSYPARGWHTYGVRGAKVGRLLLSLFYSRKQLAAAELYVPKVDRAPRLQPQDAHFRIVPGEVEVGMPVTSLPEHFGRMEGMPTQLGAFADLFEARYPGGAAYAMGNTGTIERLAIYTFAK